MPLQKLTEKDLPILIAIEEAAHITPWSEDVFIRCFSAGYHYFGIEYADNLVGFVVFSLQAGECHILNLCVRPEHQGQGLGYQLLSHALSEAKTLGAGIAFLEVRRSNSQALSLYKKMGFIKVGERKDYYPYEKGREDALVFAKDLGVR